MQACVPGVYAWAVTVAPTVWNDGEPLAARVAGLAAPVFLVFGAILEPRVGLPARILSLWSFVIACGFVWGAAPNELTPLRLDPVRGVAGMLGWALFALASAAGPASRSMASRGPAGGMTHPGTGTTNVEQPASRWRLDIACVVVGALVAAVMQFGGWQISAPESALFVRFVTVAAGLATLTVATNVATGRRPGGAARAGVGSKSLRFALIGLVALGAVALVRLLFLRPD